MRRLHRADPRRRGVILVWALFVVFLVGASTFVTMTVSSTSLRTADLAVDRTRAEALCHAALEEAEAQIDRALQVGAEPAANGTATLDGAQATFTVVRAGAPAVTMGDDGLQREGHAFLVEAEATVERATLRLRRVVRASAIPIFQFSIFYENDLEFYNPAPWTIQGRIHCNSDIFVRLWTSLTFDTNYLHAAGGIYGRAPFGSWAPLVNGVAPRIRRWVPDPFDPAAPVAYEPLPAMEDLLAHRIASTGGVDSDFGGYDANGDGDTDDAGEFGTLLQESLERFSDGAGSASTLQTNAHGAGRLAPPRIESLDMYVPAASGGDHALDAASGEYVPVAPGTGTHRVGQYAANAGLRIETRDDGTWKAVDGNGFDVTSQLQGAIRSSQIFDRRQSLGFGRRLNQLEIDVAAVHAAGLFPANGLMYMVGHGAGDGADVQAFTLQNASELPGPLSVVTPNSVYLQGDYNVTDPKPAAVMADAVNLLSNAWDNQKRPGALPVATETRYHVSVVTGDVESTSGTMGGGPHNLLRRHEDWSTIPEHVVGSIICPFRSRYATGEFRVGDDYYQPPDRYWSFDHRNNDSGSRPPYAPVTVETVDVLTWIPTP